MYYLFIITGLLILISFIADHKKTQKALMLAFKKLIKIAPAFFLMLILISIILYLAPDKIISKYLGNKNLFISISLASFFGSITILPGFIAFPLSGILLS